MNPPSKSKTFTDSQIASLEPGRRKNPEYHREIDRLFRFLIPQGVRVLELGCGTGRLLAKVKPSYGLGFDKNTDRISAAKQIYADRRELEFITADVEEINYSDRKPFDYIILSDLVATLNDVQKTLTKLHAVCTPHTRVIINFHSNLWRPVFFFATLIGRREPYPNYNWLSMHDIQNLLRLSGFESITRQGRILWPLKLPAISWIMNRLLAKIPFFRIFCLTWCITARPKPKPLPTRGQRAPSVSVLIPTRNEKGNIEGAFTRTPKMGRYTELVFIDGHSDDGTVEEIQRCIEKYSNKWKHTKLLHQTGTGKGQAVRQGFEQCTGDILMILDSDLTMPPEDLPKYYQAITSGHGEFINGCRLIYPMEKQSMRFLNMIANHIFSLLFTWLLSQPIKDTLCGTKTLRKKDYESIAANRSYFGDFDPFGDFDLLLGASKLNLKIIDMPIRYREREYGEIKISRWKHGLLLMHMSIIAFKKLKLS